MAATLVMALLVLLGIGWFFRDQIRVAYITYTLQHAPEEESSPLTTNSPPAVPTAAFSPGAPPALPPPGPGDTPPAQTALPPQTAPAPAASSVAKAASPVSNPATLAPPQAMPPTAPPVTVLPPLPITAEDRRSMDGPPASIRKSEQPVSLSPNAAPPRIFENATPESQGAVDALKQFLAAPNWTERQKVVQTADKVRPLMEQYYHQNPDGPSP
ncbi:hypothetical protein [Verrucomicrobium spinosum]|uniref:hypothetical protein n=1 Tax=Verrucomicrobium spinosum TaxID=2736 RepID=UPI0009463926|nr:hypothetical protein [Verrucomicrobium spinosum]